MQDVFNFMKPKAEWRVPSLSDLPQSWQGMRRIGYDTETRDPDLLDLGPGCGLRANSYPVGFSLAFEDGRSFYLPIRHQGGDNLDEKQVLDYLRHQAKNYSGQIVGMNLGYDIEASMSEGIYFPLTKFRDVQFAAVLIDELQDTYNLNDISKRLGFSGKDESLLKEAAAAYRLHPKKDLWKLPARYVAPYAEEDAALVLKVLRKQEFRIEEDELWEAFDLECELLPILCKVRQRGIRINLQKLENIERWSREQEAEELAKVKHITGVSINVGDVWKKRALLPAVTYMGVPFKYTAKGEPSIDKEFFANIDHPVARALERARKVNKLRTTFAASVREHLSDHGRIHTTLNQMAREREEDEDGVKGGRYGRLSSDHPNLQQQPSRDEFAAMWRDIYEPEEGELWAAEDYSQQEPRMTTHFAAACNFPKAKEAAQRYWDDPKADNHTMMGELIYGRKPTDKERKYAKEIFLGLCYGMGGAKLCRKLHLPTRYALWVKGASWAENETHYAANREELDELVKKYPGSRFGEVAGEEGQKLLDLFDEKVPYVRKLSDKCKNQAKENGYIRLLDGRRMHFPKDESGKYDFIHKALNRLIQGNSAVQTKKAMVEVDKAGHHILLQVHDEIGCSVRSPEEAAAIAKIMQECLPLKVPSRVDVEIGPSWGSAK